jgi:hypothetical protein
MFTDRGARELRYREIPQDAERCRVVPSGVQLLFLPDVPPSGVRGDIRLLQSIGDNAVQSADSTGSPASTAVASAVVASRFRA